MNNVIKNIILSFFIFYSYAIYAYSEMDARALVEKQLAVSVYDVVKLKGGLSDAQLFIVRVEKKTKKNQQYLIDYVVRYLENKSEESIQNEIMATLDASKNDYGPRVWFVSVKDAVIIMDLLPKSYEKESDNYRKCCEEFAKSRNIDLSKEELKELDIIEYEELNELSLLLQKIHNNNSKSVENYQNQIIETQLLNFDKTINKIRTIDQITKNITYINLIDKQMASNMHLDYVQNQVNKINAALAKHIILRPCHNDLKKDNIIWKPQYETPDMLNPSTIPIAIDYETAAPNDPYFDVATIAMYFCHTPESENFLLKKYLQKDPTSEDKAKLYLMKQLVLLRYGLCSLKKVYAHELYIMSCDPGKKNKEALPKENLKKNSKIKYVVNKVDNTIYAINTTDELEPLKTNNNDGDWLNNIIQKGGLNSTIKLNIENKKIIQLNTGYIYRNDCALKEATILINLAIKNFESSEFQEALSLLCKK